LDEYEIKEIKKLEEQCNLLLEMQKSAENAYKRAMKKLIEVRDL